MREQAHSCQSFVAHSVFTCVFFGMRDVFTASTYVEDSLAWPDHFFPFFFSLQRKTEKSGLATRDYVEETGPANRLDSCTITAGLPC